MNSRLAEDLKSGIYSVVKCPCCGEDTLDMNYICPNCKWEYDGIPSEDMKSYCNGGKTLKEYRESFYKSKK